MAIDSRELDKFIDECASCGKSYTARVSFIYRKRSAGETFECLESKCEHCSHMNQTPLKYSGGRGAINVSHPKCYKNSQGRMIVPKDSWQCIPADLKELLAEEKRLREVADGKAEEIECAGDEKADS